MKMLKWLSLVLLIVIMVQCSTSDNNQQTHNSMDVKWEIKEDQGKHIVSFQIKNTSGITLNNSNWKLYFNQITGASNDNFDPSGVQIEHVSGYFFALSPTSDFNDLAPGDSITFSYSQSDALSRFSFVPEGMYAVIEDQEPYAIPEPFVTYYEAGIPEEIRGDSPEELYGQYSQMSLLEKSELGIIPSPNQVKKGNGELELTEFSIGYESGMEQVANHLGLRVSTFFQGNVHLAGDSDEANIVLEYTDKVEGMEEYNLSVTPTGVRIAANHNKGLFYGVQSLTGLLPTSEKSDTVRIPIQEISDAPRFAYRGLHIDLARNFKNKESIKKVLDIMAYYKLNKLNLQLTDDEGWRIEIESLPELTEIGARRGHTLDESDRIYPSYGSGPNPVDDDMGGTGYLTQEDFIEIIRYAASNQIEVIPKIDVPGHNRAAIIAMKARYKRIMEESGNEALASEYLLTDPEDESEYMSVQGYNDNVVCVCMESTYKFVETVVDEMISMYHEAGVDLNVVHIGGDEVPGGVWEKSPKCEEMISELGIEGTKNELAAYFVGRVSEILSKRGLVTSGWEEIVMVEEHETLTPNTDFVNRPIVPYAWHKEYVNPLANAGFKVVMGNANSLYFDMAYDGDPMEPGLVWAGKVGSDETFNLDPYRLVDVDEPLEKRENILGIQAQTWGETIWNEERLEYYLFPKLIALSERAWSAEPQWARTGSEAARQQKWNRFANTMAQKEFDRLQLMTGGLIIRLPKPGLEFVEGNIVANVAFPGLEIRYTTDGSEPDASSPVYTGPIEAGGTIRARAFSGSNMSATSTVSFK